MLKRLSFGQFFGREQSALEIRGFALAHLSPTVPEREVVRHTHEEAHFVLVTSGAYLTSAREAPDLCTAPTLIYNPPGTTHRDCFRSQSGEGKLPLSEVAQASGFADQSHLTKAFKRAYGVTPSDYRRLH